ncbi:hypothetical protein SFRURICE_017869 [Spodoptera frugiperda]|nr:hypothetical protein SFRURICE_017869 [Spodoptera frugiperda]
MQRHAFYPRMDRQRGTLRHVMPLYNVHPLFTICVISPILRGTTQNFFENPKNTQHCFGRSGNRIRDPEAVFISLLKKKKVLIATFLNPLLTKIITNNILYHFEKVIHK